MTWPPERHYLMIPEMQSWAQIGQAPSDGESLVSGSADKPESAWRNGGDQWVVRGDPATRAFSPFGLRDGKLVLVESVNRAGDHAAAKRIIGTTKTLTPEEAADPAFDLRGLAKR
jgi:formylmethanofuran dehydrogenase subunit C